ncbi:MAG TPA: hypothetical protein VFK40_06580 [Nitrososphaeraceae archaeon]|nr:hypothetical protein [Nitrososphaeraceae archaeon]
MHKSIIIFIGLLVILLPLGNSLNISNANAIADFDNKEDRKQQVGVNSLKCNNINVNVNGLELNVLPPFLDGDEVAATAADDETNANSFDNNEGNSQINDFRFICINNNNNTVIGEEEEEEETNPPTPPTPTEELANLNVIKNVDCISEGGTPNDDAVCDYVLENILPSNYQMIVTGIGANANPSEFPGSSTGTNVQLGAGVEGYILTEELANTEQLEADLEASVLFTSTSVDPGSDCGAFIDQEGVFQNANASIVSGQSQTCSITNTISIGGGTVPPTPPTTASLTVKKQVFGCERFPATTVMDCESEIPNSSDWINCNNNIPILFNTFCHSLPEDSFDIKVSDDQENQIQRFKGSENGTSIQNLNPGNYTVNEIKNATSFIDQLGVNADAERDCREDGFADGGRLDNFTTPIIQYFIICFEYDDEQGNDCSNITLAAGESRTCTVKNYIQFAID